MGVVGFRVFLGVFFYLLSRPVNRRGVSSIFFVQFRVATVTNNRVLYRVFGSVNFQIRNNLPDPALVSYSVELVDEEGNELLLLPESPVTTVAGNGSAGYQLSVPADFAEGLYSYRIKAVARVGDQFADSGIALDFAILDETIYILTNEEWLELSVANGALEQAL